MSEMFIRPLPVFMHPATLTLIWHDGDIDAAKQTERTTSTISNGAIFDVVMSSFALTETVLWRLGKALLHQHQ